MQTLLIRGGRPLTGETLISGSKNAVLPMLAATVLFREPCRLRNCPNLTDVDSALRILTYLGAAVKRYKSEIHVDPRPICRWDIPQELMCSMRGAVFFAGPLIARFGYCRLSQPGGCDLGRRPVDFHIQGLETLGAKHCAEAPSVYRGSLRGAVVELPYPSVGATENLIMAALGAEEETIIVNAAREPEIVNLCDFLRCGGCGITGDGSDRIRIFGGLPQSGDIEVIPDRMEAATFACAAASAGGKVLLRKATCSHLNAVLDILGRAGCIVQTTPDGICVEASELYSPGVIITGPYPEFPTDAQAPAMGALLRAKGITIVNETVFSDRMNHINGMRVLGADICRRGNRALIRGVPGLRGGTVSATDLRAGAGLAVAALAAEGITYLHGMHHLLRGYEDFAGKLRALGADVETV